MNIAKLQPANSQVQPMPTDIARVVIRIGRRRRWAASSKAASRA